MDHPAITYLPVTCGNVQIGGQNSVGLSDHTHLEESVEENRRLLEDQDSVTRQLERDVDANCNDIQELKNEVQLLSQGVQDLKMDTQRLRQRVSDLEGQNRRPSLQRISDNVPDTNTDMSSVDTGDDINELTDTDTDDDDEEVGSIFNFPSSNTHGPVASIHPDVATCRQVRYSMYETEWSQRGLWHLMVPTQRLTPTLEKWVEKANPEVTLNVIEVDDQMTEEELETMV